ncbi:hypothetical protein SAMN06295974_0578 [Plantibacter flavus]|uniref:Integral membrane protein n=1 Tax=Plantibacter flavus TaxID=150123 RepID=A0A3N2C1G9_9MICO|nr:hypothetical protein [Plantibacter flavus]ROR81348.1 hypothetical protein EDD42_1404 [Plantibacter flavus]SMG11629.1 hypothetical protein SAMN06295974_0578 [Plantibacter flavus]
MELLFVVLGGAILGLAVRYLLPGRDQHGAALIPAVATLVAAVVWVTATWAGMAWDGGWIWVLAFGASVVVSVVVDLVLVRVRTASDEAMLNRLQQGVAA